MFVVVEDTTDECAWRLGVKARGSTVARTSCVKCGDYDDPAHRARNVTTFQSIYLFGNFEKISKYDERILPGLIWKFVRLFQIYLEILR